MVVINIDTAKDSKEEIRQTIKYLQSILGERDTDSGSTVDFVNPFAEPTSAESRDEPATGGIFGMFDAPVATSARHEQVVKDSDEEKLDAESLLAAAAKMEEEANEGYLEMKADEDPVEIVTEDDGETFIEIVEYE